MAISFENIPADVRVPLFYAEMDNSQAGFFTQNQKVLLIAQKLAAAPAASNQALLISRTDDAKEQFGLGSMMARMHETVRLNDAVGEVWCIALDDDGGAVAATGKVSIAGPASASGTINLYIAGQIVRVGVAVSDAASAIATATAAAINAIDDLPVTAAVNGSNDYEVDLTAKWSGETTNDITLIENYRGNVSNERTPSGVVLTITAMTGGATDPDIADAITAMGDEEFDFIIHPYTGGANLDALATELDDNAGRWSYSRQIYGHVYSAKRGEFSALQIFGVTRNDQHATIAGFEASVPTPVWEYAAAYGARNAVFIKADPARPTQTGQAVGVLPPQVGDRFILTERETLLNSGIATSYVGGGTVRVERAITTYQKNSFNQADTSYLDSETLHTSTYVLRKLKYAVTQKYPRHKLADDGTKFGAGQKIVTPSIIRGAMLDVYSQMEYLGIVENAELFNKYLVVERDANDSGRINVLFPADYVNQLRVFALLNQFRLQYPATA
ncbi:MAG: phage tail sheath subtilisin-like domain-containing protein [Gammaproteobacteria bacterium]|nr:phage tail sheath subtilisin-like domain-containing protein [Gammaproteobacteria bacterium]